MKKNKHRNLSKLKFMAMSKLIGLVTFGFVFMVTIYTMYEMHITKAYDALPQLIISAYGFAGVYAGFYLTMAKVEHVEEEKTKREKELANLKQSDASEEDIQFKKDEIIELRQKMSEIISEQMQSF